MHMGASTCAVSRRMTLPHLCLCGVCRGMNRAANFVVGGKHVGKRRGRGGRMYGGDADALVDTQS